MSALIRIFDDGYTKDRKGRMVSAIRFRITTGEGKPDDILAHCLPAYKDAVVKNLRRLAFQNAPIQKRACRVCGCTDDHACEGGCCWVDKDLCSACADPAHGEADNPFILHGEELERTVAARKNGLNLHND